MSSGSEEAMARSLSSAFVTAPTNEDLDFFTAARSGGGLLLENMACK